MVSNICPLVCLPHSMPSWLIDKSYQQTALFLGQQQLYVLLGNTKHGAGVSDAYSSRVGSSLGKFASWIRCQSGRFLQLLAGGFFGLLAGKQPLYDTGVPFYYRSGARHLLQELLFLQPVLAVPGEATIRSSHAHATHFGCNAVGCSREVLPPERLHNFRVQATILEEGVRLSPGCRVAGAEI